MSKSTIRFTTASVITAVLLVSACSDSDAPTGVQVGASVRIISGAPVADTIGARLAEPLIVQVTDSSGNPAKDVEVRFTSAPLPPAPHCSLFGACRASNAVVGVDTRTDSTGKASTTVRLGSVAGEGILVATVPSLAVQDTARFTIRPGQPARVTLAPRDTFVYVGTTITFRPLAIDRAGNLAGAAPTLEGPNALTIAGATVTATAFGVHQLTARAGALTDIVKVSVVPRGSIAAVESYWPSASVIIVFDLDGTTRARISTNTALNGLTWTPDGSSILYARPDGLMQYRLYKATLDGAISRLLPASAARDEQRPTFTRDGRWLYFAEKPDLDTSWYVWRARPDGTGLERVSAAIRSATGPLRPTFGPSPDGSRVAFSRLVCCQTTQRLLTVASVPGGSTVDLTIDAEGARWSPTDEMVGYATQTGIGVVRQDGSGDRKFAEPYMGWGDLSFDWSPDGRWLIARTSGPLQLIEAATGLRIPLTYAPAAYQPSWKP